MNNNTKYNEEESYELALREIESDTKKMSIWAKALSKKHGNIKEAEAFYLKLRVKDLKEEARRVEAERNKKEVKNKEKKKIKEVVNSYFGSIVALFLVIVGIEIAFLYVSGDIVRDTSYILWFIVLGILWKTKMRMYLNKILFFIVLTLSSVQSLDEFGPTLFSILIVIVAVVLMLDLSVRLFKSKKENWKRYSATVMSAFVIVMMLVIYLTVDSNSSKLEDRIIATVQKAKETTKLPVIIDENTKLVDITPEAKSIRYHFLVDLSKEYEEPTGEELKQVNLKTICNNPITTNLFKYDVNIEYMYKYIRTKNTALYTISKEDCLKY